MRRSQNFRPVGLAFKSGCFSVSVKRGNKRSWSSHFRKAWKWCVEDLAGRDFGGEVLRGLFQYTKLSMGGRYGIGFCGGLFRSCREEGWSIN